MSDAITSTKLEHTGRIFWDGRCCFCVLSPAHESEMRGYFVYVLIVKKLISLILFKFSHSILNWTVQPWNWGGGFLKHF